MEMISRENFDWAVLQRQKFTCELLAMHRPLDVSGRALVPNLATLEVLLSWGKVHSCRLCVVH